MPVLCVSVAIGNDTMPSIITTMNVAVIEADYFRAVEGLQLLNTSIHDT